MPVTHPCGRATSTLGVTAKQKEAFDGRALDGFLSVRRQESPVLLLRVGRFPQTSNTP